MDTVVKTNPSGRPSRIPFDLAATRGSLFHAFLDARTEFGGGTPALVDGDGRVLTYDELARASFALGHALRKGTRREEKVGVMLPTGAGAAVAFLALTAYGRVPTMINFTSGAADLKSAIRTAEVKRVVTAHRFIELGKLEEVAETLSEVAELIYLEDVRAKLSLSDKLTGLVGSLSPNLMLHRTHSDKPAAILFTSG